MLSLLVALAPNFRTFLYEYSIAVVVALCYKVTMLMNFFSGNCNGKGFYNILVDRVGPIIIYIICILLHVVTC